MINKYKNANNDLKEYKVSKVKCGTAKNDKPYTVFTISDKITKPDGSSAFDYYSVFSWQEDLKLLDGDKIAFEEITALEVKEDEYNGKTYLKKTIFASVKVTQSTSPNQVDIVENDNKDPFGSDDNLPF